ncbi:MAG: hypothetical protein JW839_02725 [Candidatus Lokiarchaeota archaeon]|nr:hypothetical protein [Candidatus Lokiarchaeota archaeon]
MVAASPSGPATSIPREASPRHRFLSRLVDVQRDFATHKKIVSRGLASSTAYAVFYGVYEYFIVYEFLMWDVFDEEVNWAIMVAGLVVVVLASTRGNAELCVVNLLYVFLLEDLTYWFCQWAETGAYPFPAPDWFDGFFASFRVLGGIGRAVPFWPYIPLFYIPGYSAVIVYYIASWRSAKAGRVVAWIIGPIFIAIVAGTMLSEEVATLLLITIPVALFSLAVVSLAVKRYGTRPHAQGNAALRDPRSSH